MRVDIQQALNKFNIKTFGNAGNIEKVEKKLWNNEIVQYISPTNALIYSVNTKKKEKLPGVFVLTDQRILFYYKAGFNESTETFSLSEVNSINCSGNGLTGGHIEVHTITKTLDILVTYKKETMQAIQDVIDTTIRNYKQKGNSPQVENVDVSEQIENLFKLKEKGIITTEEFDAKKKQLLGL